MEIIVRSFTPHYNRAMGKVIKSESQYKDEMKRGGYVSYDQCKETVKNNLEKQRQFSVSSGAQEWMRDVKSSSDSKGNVRLSDRQIDALKERGMASASKAPKDLPTSGGIRGE